MAKTPTTPTDEETAQTPAAQSPEPASAAPSDPVKEPKSDTLVKVRILIHKTRIGNFIAAKGGIVRVTAEQAAVLEKAGQGERAGV